MNPGTTRGKLWLSTTCQWKVFIWDGVICQSCGLVEFRRSFRLTLTQLIASRVRLMSETGKLRCMVSFQDLYNCHDSTY